MYACGAAHRYFHVPANQQITAKTDEKSTAKLSKSIFVRLRLS
jgi:hypothetical protein